MAKPVSPAARPGGNPLGTEPVLRLVLKFSIPAIVSMLVNTLYNITDQIFIGHAIGVLGNAATTVAFPMVFLTNSAFLLFGVGTAANFNICMGAKREEDARRFLHTGLFLMFLCGAALAVLVGLFRGPLLWLCGATDTVYPYAYEYLTVTVFGLFFVMVSGGAAFLIRADGSPAYAMNCTLAGVIVNVVLDWLFLFPLGMGIFGAALATVIGQVISFVITMLYFTRYKSFPISVKELRFRAPYAKGIVRLGMPNFLNQVLMMALNILMNNLLCHYGALSAYGGDIPLAVSGIVNKLNVIMVSVSVGLGQGCQPIWGFNLGAGKYARVKEAYLKASVIAVAIGMVMFALFQLFPRPIISIFGTGSELYFSFAEQYLRIFMVMVGLNAIQPLTLNFLSGTGNAKLGTAVSICRQGVFLMPLLLFMSHAFGMNGILYAGPIGDALGCLASAGAAAYVIRQMGRPEQPE